VQLLEERLALLERRLTSIPTPTTTAGAGAAVSGTTQMGSTGGDGTRSFTAPETTGVMVSQSDMNSGSMDGKECKKEEAIHWDANCYVDDRRGDAFRRGGPSSRGFLLQVYQLHLPISASFYLGAIYQRRLHLSASVMECYGYWC
jgi:hypothetical protein